MVNGLNVKCPISLKASLQGFLAPKLSAYPLALLINLLPSHLPHPRTSSSQLTLKTMNLGKKCPIWEI